MNYTDKKHISWIFVCQSGRLELEACLLAASLRRMLGSEVNLIAAVPMPEPAMGTVAPEVIRFLESQAVTLRPFTNSFVKEGRDSISALLMNKAFALTVESSASINVFLDSDQVCHSPFDFSNLAVPLVARRAFYPGAKATQGIWERAYEICETEMPRHRIAARSLAPADPIIICPPFFNSGFISIHRPWAHEFVENYLDCYRRIALHGLLGENHYFEEQMAMAIAVIKTRVPYDIDNHRIDTALFHYYSIPRLASFRQFAQVVCELATTTPGLRDILATDAQWRSLLNGSPVSIRKTATAADGDIQSIDSATARRHFDG